MTGRRPRRLPLLGLAPLLLLLLPLVDAVGIVAGMQRPAACVGGPALVMGAAQYDGRPSPAFERRLEAAAEAWREGCVDSIVVSGGARPGDRLSEGEAGVAWLMRQGVPEPVLFAETTARNSAENLAASLPLLAGSKRVTIVTDDLHMWRASVLARSHGLRPAPRTVRGGGGFAATFVREFAALLAYRTGLSY